MRRISKRKRRADFPTRLQMSERQKLLKMEKTLRKEVVGQEKAVAAVANAIRLNRSGLSNQDRPIASFLFVGPSGTGKTQLAKALAKFLFDSPDAMLRIDASEYVSRFAFELSKAGSGGAHFDSCVHSRRSTRSLA